MKGKCVLLLTLVLVLISSSVLADTQTRYLDLTLPSKGAEWRTSINNNFTAIDNRAGYEDTRYTDQQSQIYNLYTFVDDVPEGYHLSGTFNSTTGTAFAFASEGMQGVANINQYVVVVTPNDANSTIGTVAVEKQTTGFTVKCSGANVTSTFDATVFYLQGHNTYGDNVRGVWYVSPDNATSDHGASGTAGTIETGSLADITKYLENQGTKGFVVLPANKTLQLYQPLTILENSHLVFQPGAKIKTNFSVRNSTYRWTKNGATNEYYLELAGGGSPGIGQVDYVYENGVAMTSGTVGSLAAGEWAWSSGTIYVRLSGSTDPDLAAEGFVTAEVSLSIYSPDYVSAGKQQQIFDSSRGVYFQNGGTVQVEWFPSSDYWQAYRSAARYSVVKADSSLVYITNTLEFYKDDVHLAGLEQQASTVKPLGIAAGSDMVHVGNVPVGQLYTPRFLSIRDLLFDGDRTAARGIVFYSAYQDRLTNVTVDNCTTTGIQLGVTAEEFPAESGYLVISSTRFDHVYIGGCPVGLHLYRHSGAPGFSDVLYSEDLQVWGYPDGRNNLTTGIKLQNGSVESEGLNVSFSNTRIENAESVGVDQNGTWITKFESGYIENYDLDGNSSIPNSFRVFNGYDRGTIDVTNSWLSHKALVDTKSRLCFENTMYWYNMSGNTASRWCMGKTSDEVSNDIAAGYVYGPPNFPLGRWTANVSKWWATRFEGGAEWHDKQGVIWDCIYGDQLYGGSYEPYNQIWIPRNGKVIIPIYAYAADEASKLGPTITVGSTTTTPLYVYYPQAPYKVNKMSVVMIAGGNWTSDGNGTISIGTNLSTEGWFSKAQLNGMKKADVLVPFDAKDNAFGWLYNGASIWMTGMTHSVTYPEYDVGLSNYFAIYTGNGVHWTSPDDKIILIIEGDNLIEKYWGNWSP